MQVFISWSGDKSHKVALALHDWLPLVLQAIKPFVSSEDIDKGALWGKKLVIELDETEYGVVCITRDNQDSAWMNYEAGAIGKRFTDGRVAGFLVDLAPSDVAGPLKLFQLTLPEQGDVLKLMRSLNKALPTPVEDAVLVQQVTMWWPKFEEALTRIGVEEAVDPWAPPVRNDRQLLEELVGLTRGIERSLLSPRPAALHGYDVSPHQRDIRLRHEVERVHALLDKYGVPPFTELHITSDESGISLVIIHGPEEKLTQAAKDEFIRAAFTRGWSNVRWIESTSAYVKYSEPDVNDDDEGGFFDPQRDAPYL